jgi:hypothetical protein
VLLAGAASSSRSMAGATTSTRPRRTAPDRSPVGCS